MEKIRREIRLFWTRNGKLLLQIIGGIVLVIFIIQSLNQYTISRNKEQKENALKTKEIIEKQEIQEKEEKEYRKFISSFLEYCNNKEFENAYNMLSETCKKEKYINVKEFKEQYINKILNGKKEYSILLKENNVYHIVFLEDILQAGTIDNRKQKEDYYSIEEDVLGNKKININIYNDI